MLTFMLGMAAGAVVTAPLTVVAIGFNEMGLLTWRPWRRRGGRS